MYLIVLFLSACIVMKASALECYFCRGYKDGEDCWKTSENTLKSGRDYLNVTACKYCFVGLENVESKEGVLVERGCVTENDIYGDAPYAKCTGRFDGVHNRHVCYCDSDLCNSDEKSKTDAESLNFKEETMLLLKKNKTCEFKDENQKIELKSDTANVTISTSTKSGVQTSYPHYYYIIGSILLITQFN